LQTGSWATLRPWQSRYSLSLASLICCGQLACYLPSLPAAQAQAVLSVYCSMLCSHSYSYATHISVQAPLVTNCSHVIPQHANLGSSGLCPEIYPCRNKFKLPPSIVCLRFVQGMHLFRKRCFCVSKSVQITSSCTTAVDLQLVPCLQVGGHWLSWWMVAAAAVSQICQFEAEMSSDSFQLLGMAERGFLPKALGRRSKHDTPTVSLLMCGTRN